MRDVRTKKGLSVNELAARSSVSAGMISQIERGISSPSVKTLERLRTALDVSLTDLFSESVSEDRERPGVRREGCFVRRRASRPKFSVQASGLRKELLTPEGQHDLQFMLIHFDPGTSSTEVLMGAGEKGGMVLTGKLELMVGDETVEIVEGDSFQFNSALAHRVRNVSPEVASVIWFMDTRRPRVEM
nr:helix-turn-helix domain-containing protein [Caballeronia sp. AZ7_KS35]